MVRVATRIGSTPRRPSEHEATAFTILLTSTGSRSPLRLRTRMPTAVSMPAAGPLSGISSMPAVAMVGAPWAGVAGVVGGSGGAVGGCRLVRQCQRSRLLGFPVAGGRAGVVSCSDPATGARSSGATELDDNVVVMQRRTGCADVETGGPDPFAGSPWSDARSVGLCWVAARAPDTGAGAPGAPDYSRVVTTLSRGLSCLFVQPREMQLFRVLGERHDDVATVASAAGDDAAEARRGAPGHARNRRR